MKEFKLSFVVGESPSSYLKPSKSRSRRKAPYSPCGKKSGPAGPLLRCHKCGKLGHTANKCRSSEFFPQTRAREVNEFTEVDEFTEVTEVTQVMSCFRCGREGHIAKNCRQGSVCNNCRQGSVCRKCGMKGHTEINCRVQYKGWTKSGNEGREFVSNPRTAQTKKQ